MLNNQTQYCQFVCVGGCNEFIGIRLEYVIRICKSKKGQTTQWSNEKGQKDKQQSTQITKD